VTEDIRALTAALAADPTSLVFLRLGEVLRRRGQLDSAQKVALAGLNRYPHLPDAHDLFARILADRHDFATAFDEWDMALRLDPRHVGSLKGIGFLYFQAGDRENALQHLRAASQILPGDEGIEAALALVEKPDAPPGHVSPTSSDGEARSPAAEPPAPAEAPDDQGPFAGVEGPRNALLLVDESGLRLAGEFRSLDGGDISEEIGACGAGAAREAGRAARILGLGEWKSVLVESGEWNFSLVQPTPDTCLIAARPADAPVGQVGFLAERAAKAARSWLELVR
jgi:tetratricopeptide (TPR) repeat protein